MAKNSNKIAPITIPEPPLFIKLSDAAAAALRAIRGRYNWNKKTAVELALQKFAADLDKPRGTK